MALYGYNGEIDDCQWISYSDSITYDHDIFPPQSSSRCSFYEFDVPKSIQNCYDYNQFDSDTNTIQSAEHYYYYSVYGYNEPKLIQYEQPPSSSYVSESLYHQTAYITSYSTLQFNEPEFDEYDQTPYGGGYDIAETYGKPLPPSDDICYPRSNPKRRVTFAIPESVNVENADTKPQIAKGIDKENQPNGDREDKASNVEDVILEKPIEVDEDLANDYGKGYEGNGEVPKYPYGSGLEALDICDSIFGYWPCLEKRNKQNLANGKAVDDQGDPWKNAADYLFGSGFVYEEESRGNSHGHGYGYYVDGHHFEYSYMDK